MNTITPISIWSAHMINCFLIQGTNGHILVDTGLPNSEQKILNQLREKGIEPNDIQLIIVTHSHIDHFGSAAKLKQIVNAPILAHKLDLKSYRSGKGSIETMKPTSPWWKLFRLMIRNQTAKPFQPDILLNEDEEYDLKEWGFEGKVIHTPGHTPGSLSVLLNNGNAIIMDMMSSGIFLGGILMHSNVKHPPFHDSLADLKKSFDKLLLGNSKVFYLGHGKPVNRNQLIKYYEKYLS